jgi:hypothetical protein
MNKELVKYGIFEEESDYRAHVGGDKCVYVFKTQNCIDALNETEYPLNPATQQGIVTAKGYCIPVKKWDGTLIKNIKGIRRLKYHSWPKWDLFDNNWNTPKKGDWAVECVLSIMRKGRFPFYISAKPTNNIQLDIDGTDILVENKTKIQVKCDFPIKYTDNLYIQTHECNPFKKYSQSTLEFQP